MSNPTLSVVVPIWNEEETIPELYRRMQEVMSKTGVTWELVMVSDGSTDRSTEMIRDLAKQDAHIRPVIFARNFGHQIAVTAGMAHSRGDAVVLIDADLQDPPELIIDMLAKWREGYEVVYAVRATREGESKFKLWTAKMFYRLINALTDTEIPLDTGDFRLMDRAVVDVMNRMGEHHRFIRGMVSWVGYKQIGIEYDRKERYAGETKYPLKKMLTLAMTAITGFSNVPLRLATYTGFISAAISIIFIPVVIIMRMMGNQAFFGQATTLIAVLFLGGAQLMALGILGEYIGRLYDEGRNRPLYIARETPEDFEKYHSEK